MLSVLVFALSCNAVGPGAFMTRTVMQPSSGGSPVTLIGSIHNGGGSFGGASDSVSWTATAGSAYIVVWEWHDGTGVTTSSVTSVVAGSATIKTASTKSSGNPNYTQIGTQAAYFLSSTGGAETVTVNMSAGTFVWMHVYEVTAANFDQSSTSQSGSTGTIAAGTFTPAANGAYLVVAGAVDDGIGSGSYFSAGTSFTITYNYGGGSFDAGGESFAQTTAASTNCAFGNTNSNSWVATAIIMKP